MKYFFVVFMALLLYSCGEETKSQQKSSHNVTSNATTPLLLKTADTIPPQTMDVVTIEIIDSAAFYKEKHIADPIKKEYHAITNAAEAQRMLKGLVKFGEYDEDLEAVVQSDTGHIVYEAHTRDGRVIISDLFESPYFMAYYPELDLMVCEGGHTSDVSFDLVTGDGTEVAGNPDNMVISKDGSIRLNGWFAGQECIDSYIQQRINGRYYNVLPLFRTFWEKLPDNYGICQYRDAFWKGNRQLYIKGDQDYFLVTLTLPE